MYTKLITALVILVALALVPYVLGPILIRRTLKQSGKPELGSFPVDDPTLPKKVASFFRKVTQALQPLGFEVIEGLTLPNQTPKVKAIVVMLANRSDKVAALASAVFAETEQGQKLKTAS